MRKLVLYFCLAGLALGQTPQPTDTVLAWKPQTPYMHGGSGWPSMPHNLWTNTVFWLTAESPVLNAGATNANWICYAKTCTGNAYQTVVNSQPLRVETNGVWVLQGDGVDDVIFYPTTPLLSGTNNFSVSVWINFAGQWPTGSTSRTAIGVSNTSTTNGAWSLSVRGPSAAVIADAIVPVVSETGANLAFADARVLKSELNAGWNHIVYTRNDREWSAYLNGTFRRKDNAFYATLYSSAAPLSVFSTSAPGAATLPALIESVSCFRGVLTSNDVSTLYNSTKGKFGL